MKRALENQPSAVVEAIEGVESSILALQNLLPKLDAFTQAVQDLQDTLQAIRSMNEHQQALEEDEAAKAEQPSW